jgi:transposase
MSVALTSASPRLELGAPKGERAFGRAPRNRGKNTTLIAALSSEGMRAPMSVEGATDSIAFEIYVEHFLCPALLPGQVIILDNLGAHKGGRVEELIKSRGCELLFLPSYSPDFSPIEEAFSKIKAIVRKAEARTREGLLEAIAQALEAVTRQDAKGWFAHCGYHLETQRS